MSIIIFGKSPDWEYRWVLRRGQRATIGRSPWAEFCIEGDDQLRDLHCQLALDEDACPTIKAIADAPLQFISNWTPAGQGQELQILVGQTHLKLWRDRHPVAASMNNASTNSPVTMTNTSPPDQGLLRNIGISEEACAIITQQASSLHSVQALVDHDLSEDAVRFLTASLSLRQRMNWCHQLLQHAGCPVTGPAAGLLPLWLAEPTETLRQAIASHVDWTLKLDPSTWLKASVGWTGGNLSAADSIHVPPTEQMVITGVITALALAGAQTSTKQFQAYALETGIELLRT